MRYRWSICAAALLAVASSSSLHGQSADATRSVTFRVAAGGAVPLGGALDGYETGGLLSGAVRIGTGRLVALQIEALYARFGADVFIVPGPADEPVFVGPRTSFTVLTATGVLSPWRSAAVRPYLVAGGGYYHYDFDDDTDVVEIVVTPGPGGDAFGVTYGGGIEASLGWFVPFVEVRQHIVFRSADNMSFVPVVVGIRF